MDPLSWAGVLVGGTLAAGLVYSVVGFHLSLISRGRHRR